MTVVSADFHELRTSDLKIQLETWRLELTLSYDLLELAQNHSPDEMSYGGAASACENLLPLQQRAERAKDVIAQIKNELRKRVEGSIPFVVRVEEAKRGRMFHVAADVSVGDLH